MCDKFSHTTESKESYIFCSIKYVQPDAECHFGPQEMHQEPLALRGICQCSIYMKQGICTGRLRYLQRPSLHFELAFPHIPINYFALSKMTDAFLFFFFFAFFVGHCSWFLFITGRLMVRQRRYI